MGILVAKGLMVLVNVNSVRSPEKVVQLGIIPGNFPFFGGMGWRDGVEEPKNTLDFMAHSYG